MKPPAFLCFAIFMAVGCHAGAQTTTPPGARPVLPPGPILGATPDSAAWTIVLQTVPGLHGQSAEAVALSATSSAPPDSLISVTKTGQIRHQNRKLKTGQQEDIWYEHGNRITMESSWKIPMFEVATSPAGQPQGPDFPELAWIGAANFVGVQKYQGLDYLVFESEVTDTNPAMVREGGNKQTKMFNRAYVNADNHLPWLLQTGDVLHRYVFQVPPTAPLAVPPEFQAMFDTFEKKKVENRRKPVAP